MKRECTPPPPRTHQSSCHSTRKWREKTEGGGGCLRLRLFLLLLSS